jgi:uncharacterized protein (DUF58 family)
MSLPDLQELLALRSELQSLKCSAKRPGRAIRAGAHNGIQRGRGLEFQEVRQYVEGDDPRNIDWRVTARRGRAHTKLFHQERERPVWLLTDLSPGMFFGSRVQLKSTLAVRAAALVAWSAAVGGDRVGGVIVGTSGFRVLPPRAREAGVLPLLSALIQMQPIAPAPSGEGHFCPALRALMTIVRSGSLVVAISDFRQLDSTDDGDWAALARRNDLRFFWTTDVLEQHGLPNGRFRAGVPGRLRTVDGHSVRAAWRARWSERERRLEALAQRVGAPLVRLDTRESALESVRKLLAERRAAA